MGESMFKKIIKSIGLSLIICVGFIGLFSACVSYDYTCVRIYIQEDYYEKFDSMEFVLEDFQMDNTKEFSYYCYYTYEEGVLVPMSEQGRFIKLFLKQTGKQYALQAIEHLNTLEFVALASLNSRSASPGTLYNKNNEL